MQRNKKGQQQQKDDQYSLSITFLFVERKQPVMMLAVAVEEEEAILQLPLKENMETLTPQAYHLARTFVSPMDKSIKYQRRCSIYKKVIGMACAYGCPTLMKMLIDETSMQIDINEPCQQIKCQNHTIDITFVDDDEAPMVATYLIHTVIHMLHGKYKSLENHIKVIHCLMEKGATMNCSIGNHTHLLSLVLHVNPMLFNTFVQYGIDFPLSRGVMKAAIQSGSVECVNTVLNTGWYTPTISDLYQAYRSNHIQMTRIFLSRHISPNERDLRLDESLLSGLSPNESVLWFVQSVLSGHWDESLLYLALLAKNKEMMELLVQFGADVDQAVFQLSLTLRNHPKIDPTIFTSTLSSLPCKRKFHTQDDWDHCELVVVIQYLRLLQQQQQQQQQQLPI